MYFVLKIQQANLGDSYIRVPYVAIESTRRLVEHGTPNTHTARVFSVLSHMFARKQCIPCSALLHKGHLPGGRGVLLGILDGDVAPGSSNPDPISDQKM